MRRTGSPPAAEPSSWPSHFASRLESWRKSALDLAETRYRVGSGDLRSVQQQQVAYLSSRMNLLRVRSEQRVQRVNLHLALGGDFTAEA